MLLTNRKRKREEMERSAEEEKERKYKKETEDMMHTIFSLKQKIDDYQNLEKENDENSKKLAKLYDMRVINEYGDPIHKSSDEM